MGLDNNDYEKEALKVELELLKLFGALLLGLLSVVGAIAIKGTESELFSGLLVILGIISLIMLMLMYLKSEKIYNLLSRIKQKQQ